MEYLIKNRDSSPRASLEHNTDCVRHAISFFVLEHLTFCIPHKMRSQCKYRTYFQTLNQVNDISYKRGIKTSSRRGEDPLVPIIKSQTFLRILYKYFVNNKIRTYNVCTFCVCDNVITRFDNVTITVVVVVLTLHIEPWYNFLFFALFQRFFIYANDNVKLIRQFDNCIVTCEYDWRHTPYIAHVVLFVFQFIVRFFLVFPRVELFFFFATISCNLLIMFSFLKFLNYKSDDDKNSASNSLGSKTLNLNGAEARALNVFNNKSPIARKPNGNNTLLRYVHKKIFIYI